MNRIPYWILAAALVSTSWLTGCRQVSTSPCGNCPACRAAAVAKAQNAQPKIVALEVAQGPNKETIYVVPDGSSRSIPLPNAPATVTSTPGVKVETSALPTIADGPSPAPPLPFAEEPKGALALPTVPRAPASPSTDDAAKVKGVAVSIPTTNPVLPMWTSPNETPSATPVPMPAPGMPATKATAIFSHSDDYRVLVGQVQSWRRGWRLRYADFGTEDQHGGSVVLEGGNLDRVQDGSLLRIQGTLIPATERTSPARFQVQSVEVLKR